MYRKFLIVSMVLGFLFAAAGLSAQNYQPLPFGSSLSGNLNYGDEIWFAVTPTETSMILVETTGSTDTYLEVYDAQRNLIAEDDDGGDNLNAKIQVMIAAGRTYYVKLRGYGSSSVGPYRIWAGYVSLPAATALDFGYSHQGYINSGDEHWFSVRTAQSGRITVETSGSTDTYLHIYNSSYVQLASDDDSGEGSNALIEFYADPNQTYYFKLRGYSSGTSGPYRIWALYEAVQADAGNNDRSRAVAINLGVAMQVTLRTQNESRWYSYQVTRNGSMFVIQTRGNMDTRLFLYNSNMTPVADDDDSGENYNAMISQRLNAGIYYIEVRGYSGQTGSCTLHAEIR